MRILSEKLLLTDLKQIASAGFGNMVKAVVDIERMRIALDAELHSDLEALLLGDGSSQENLWGINFYPELEGADFIEFDSMINVRPSQGNSSRGVENEGVRTLILKAVDMGIGR